MCECRHEIYHETRCVHTKAKLVVLYDFAHLESRAQNRSLYLNNTKYKLMSLSLNFLSIVFSLNETRKDRIASNQNQTQNISCVAFSSKRDFSSCLCRLRFFIAKLFFWIVKKNNTVKGNLACFTFSVCEVIFS